LSQIIAVHAVLKFPANVVCNACTLCVAKQREREREREGGRERVSVRWTFITGGEED
jgi:hypothetical protein